jgi:hypothetical protein
VVTWKDQSGNGNDATQSDPTKQPTIYTGGALVKENGKVAVEFDGANDFFESGAVTTSAQPVTVISTTTPQATAFSGGILNTTDSNNFIDFYRNDGGFAINAGTTLTSGASVDYVQDNQYLRFSLFNGASSEIFANGTSVISGNPSTTGISGNLFVGKYLTSSNNFMNGLMQEVLLYPENKSSVRTSIESNIGDYFTQNTPLLDTYSGAAAAYSLRLLDSTYTGALINVWNGTSYADIYPNVFGELDTVALAAHCGSNDGFIRYWYDQSGNSVTVSQTTTANMPKIYDGTTGVVTDNGKPAVLFDGTNDVLFQNTSLYTAGSQRNSFAVVRFDDLVSNNGVFTTDWTPRIAQNLRTDADKLYSVIFPPSGSPTILTGSFTLSTNQSLIESEYAGTDFSLYLNGSLDVTATHAQAITGACNSSIGTTFANNVGYMTGTIQEIISYESNQSSNRTNIEDNINTFYNIY